MFHSDKVAVWLDEENNFPQVWKRFVVGSIDIDDDDPMTKVNLAYDFMLRSTPSTVVNT